jgi:hypothetical protein
MTNSSLKMLTSSMPGMVLTPSLFSVLCNLLSSVVVVLCTAFFFLKKPQCSLFQNPSNCWTQHKYNPEWIGSKTENNPPEKEEPTTKTTKDNDRTQNILDSAPGKREENSLQERKISLIAAKLENPKLYKLRKQQLTGMGENKQKQKQNWIRGAPSDAALSASADSAGHLHELFLVHGDERWRCGEVAHKQRERREASQRRSPALLRRPQLLPHPRPVPFGPYPTQVSKTDIGLELASLTSRIQLVTEISNNL